MTYISKYSSVAIIRTEGMTKLLLERKPDDYRYPGFRGELSLFGGRDMPEDIRNPVTTLNRKLGEEFGAYHELKTEIMRSRRIIPYGEFRRVVPSSVHGRTDIGCIEETVAVSDIRLSPAFEAENPQLFSGEGFESSDGRGEWVHWQDLPLAKLAWGYDQILAMYAEDELGVSVSVKGHDRIVVEMLTGRRKGKRDISRQ